MNINTIIMTGRVVEDPEIKQVADTDLCSIRIASNRIVGKKKVEKTIFINVDIWGAQAKPCEKYLKKGSRVGVEGTLCQDTWDGKDGKKNSKIYIEASNVMFLDAAEKKDAPETAAPASAPAGKGRNKPAPQNNDEEIPF